MDFSRLIELLDSQVAPISAYRDVETRLDAQELRDFTPTDFQLQIAFNSAFELGLTGAAGCGKTNGATAVALYCYLFEDGNLTLNIEGKGHKLHERVAIFRKTHTQLEGIKRTLNALCPKGRFNPSTKNYILPWANCHPIRLDSLYHEGKEQNYQGIEHDFILFDEANQFSLKQIMTVLGWLRSPTAIFCRAMLSFNVPLDKKQLWIVRHYAPWVHPDLKKLGSGEIRYYYTDPITRKEVIVPSGEPVKTASGITYPLSRSCIIGQPTDNPYLAKTNYYELLKSYPAELYEILANGNFSIAFKENAFQLLSHKEMQEAYSRWEDPKDLPLTAIAADVARGGTNRLVITPLKGDKYICPQIIVPGAEVRDHFQIADLMKNAAFEWGGDENTAFITDVTGGLGAGVYDELKKQRFKSIAFDSRRRAYKAISKGRMRFDNCKSMAAYLLREGIKRGYYAIHPDNGSLSYELQSWTWAIPQAGIISVTTKGEEQTGSTVDWESPDCADSAMIAASQVDLHKVLDL